MLVVQEYQHRLAEGLVRCYFSHGEVVGFCHQWPKGLLDEGSAASTPHQRPVMVGPDAPAYQLLRHRAEVEWVPGMARTLGLEIQSLPVIWDAAAQSESRRPRGPAPNRASGRTRGLVDGRLIACDLFGDGAAWLW